MSYTGIEYPPCDMGNPTGLTRGYHRFEMNQFGACCIYCGKRGPSEQINITFQDGSND